MRVSFSQIGMFQRCPEQWRRRYIEKVVIPPAVAMVKGTSVHKTAETNFTQKLLTGTDVSKADMVDVAVDTLRTTVKNEGVLLSPDEQARGKSAVMDDAEKSVVVMSSLFADDVAPKYQPAAVEVEQTIDVGDGDELTGRVDMITDTKHVVELKTASKRMSDGEIDNMFQLTFYAGLYRVQTGEYPAGLNVERIVDKAKPETQSLTTTRGDDDVAAMLHVVGAAIKNINVAKKAGAFMYAYGQTGAWWCSNRFCGYWSTCQAVPKNKR